MTSCLPQIGKLINVEAQFKYICLGLDLFGYRPENKCKVITNIDTDASHLFYALIVIILLQKIENSEIRLLQYILIIEYKQK